MQDKVTGYLAIVMAGHEKMNVANDFELVLVKVVAALQSEATTAVAYMIFLFSPCNKNVTAAQASRGPC